MGDPEADYAEAQKVAEEAIEVFTEFDDSRGLAFAGWLLDHALQRLGTRRRPRASPSSSARSCMQRRCGDRELRRW